MQDTKKTKEQLIQELVALRQRLAACEAFNRQHQQTADALPENEAHFAGDLGSCRDITERKQMEEALRESEARYRALVEGSIQAISIVRNGRRVFANQAYATMFGYDSLLELLGRPVMDCIAPHDRDRLRHNVAAFLRGESALTRYEYQGVKNEGTLLWVEALVAPVSFQGKTALQVTLQDISERKRAEEALTQAQAGLERRVVERTAVLHEANARLRQEIAERTCSEQALRASEERWQSLVEDAPDTILEVDQTGLIRLTNRGMSGLTRAETMGTRLVDRLPIDQRPVLQYAMDRARQTGATQHCEITVSSPQGTITWWSYRVAAPTRTATDNGFLVVVTDITAHKATERALRQHDCLAAMGTLAAGIAHEINNPLGVIRLAAERARGTHTCPQAAEVTRECLDDIIANTERCTHIVKSVLHFAQQEHGDRWPADLNQIVRTAVDITRHYAEQRGACITPALAPVRPMLLVNLVAIAQVLVNLIRNAVEAGNGTVRVAIRTQVVAEQPEVVIHDTGRGIAPEHLPHIFDPFYTTRHLDGGTGLGLSLTYRMIPDHGGTDRHRQPSRPRHHGHLALTRGACRRRSARALRETASNKALAMKELAFLQGFCR
jgi:PAS domain S-box-containing protein